MEFTVFIGLLMVTIALWSIADAINNLARAIRESHP